MQMLNLIPLPVSVVPRAGEFVVGPNSRLVLGDGAPAEAGPVAEYLADGVRRATGLTLAVVGGQQAGAGDIGMAIDAGVGGIEVVERDGDRHAGEGAVVGTGDAVEAG